MSFNRKDRDDQRRREGSLTLFNLPAEEMSKDAKAQSIRNVPVPFRSDARQSGSGHQ